MKTFRIVFSASIVLLLLFSSCNNLFEFNEDSIDRAANSSRVATSRVYYEPEGVILKTETGVLGPGAEYMITLPYGWQNFPEGSRKLLIYSHGYVPQGMDFSASEEYSLINNVISYFVNSGFAVAYSSYAESGWAVKDGTIRTRQLRDYFVENIGMADDIYLYGVSEGALIAIKLAEQNPELFSGVCAFAGPIGGAVPEFDYLINTRLAFDFFFKDMVKAAALSGHPEALSLSNSLGYDLTFQGNDKSVFEVIPDPLPWEYISPTTFITQMAPLIGGLMISDPEKTLELASVMVENKYLFPFENWILNPNPNPNFSQEIIYFVLSSLWFNIYGTEDVLDKTHDRIPLDNRESVYMYIDFIFNDIIQKFVPTYPAPFDVERFESAPNAENYLEHWYKPDGELMIPVVTLHITRDPVVPYFHEGLYSEIAYPYSAMLTQIPIEGFGHGLILDLSSGTPVPDIPGTMGYIIGAFNLLVAQVEALSSQ